MFVVSTINSDLVLSAEQIYVLVYTSKEWIIAYFADTWLSQILCFHVADCNLKIIIMVSGLNIQFLLI